MGIIAGMAGRFEGIISCRLPSSKLRTPSLPQAITDLLILKGFFFYVTAAGGKFWRYRYRIGPKEKTLALGRYPEVGLVAAREAHSAARKLVSEGKDPTLEKQKTKIARIEAAKMTFRKMADEWLADQEPIWSISNAKRVRHRFERDLYPLFGNHPIGQIESTSILRALRKIEAKVLIAAEKCPGEASNFH